MIEPDNKHSDKAIVVISRNDDIAGHVPKILAKKLFNFMKSQQIVRLLATLDLPLKENGSLVVVKGVKKEVRDALKSEFIYN